MRWPTATTASLQSNDDRALPLRCDSEDEVQYPPEGRTRSRRFTVYGEIHPRRLLCRGLPRHTVSLILSLLLLAAAVMSTACEREGIMPTKISWTEETVNPFHGCTAISPGCDSCYAEKMARRLAGRYGYPEEEPFKVTLNPEALDIIDTWKKPRMVFIGSMGDIAHYDVPDSTFHKVIRAAATHPQHVLQVLTKRPARLAGMKLTIPSNLWVGVSVENAEYDWRLDYLRQIRAAVRFVSFEPLLGSVIPADLTGISWVIAGCESIGGRPGREMDLDWVRDIRDECQRQGIPFFLKQMEVSGKLVREPDLEGQQWLQFPDTTRRNGNGYKPGNGRQSV